MPVDIDSNQTREVVYKVFERLYQYKGVKVGNIDGSEFSKHFASVFQMVSEESPFVLDLEGYPTRGKELEASGKLVTRLVKRFGKGFVDLNRHNKSDKLCKVTEDERVCRKRNR